MNADPSICVRTPRASHGSGIYEGGLTPPHRTRSVGQLRRGQALERTFGSFSSSQRGNLYPFTAYTRETIDFESPEVKNAMNLLEKLFLPILIRRVLRHRKKKRQRRNVMPRLYSWESIVDAIRSSFSLMSHWPVEILKAFALEATYHYLEPNEIIVHENELYISCGVVILLHGALVGSRRDNTFHSYHPSSSVVQQFTAPRVLCDRVLLCRDASISTWTARGYADVAVIPARWVWDVINIGIEQLPEAHASVLECIRVSIVPMCMKLLDDTYYPTPLVLRRSWIWSLLGTGDRAKLARLMEPRVLCIGDRLFSEGDRDPYIHIIRRGTVTVFVQNEPLCEFGAGNAFGEVSALFNEPRCYTVVATSMCEIYSLNRVHLLRRMYKKSGLWDIVVARALERRRLWLDVGKTRDLMGLAALLTGVPCLSQTTEKMRMELARAATAHVIPPKETLFLRGDLCDQLFVIGSGSLALRNAAGTHNVRTAGGFIGELCLQPHLWPDDVVTLTSVDGWSLSVEKIMQSLATIHGEAQAEKICRQGIDLYRAQYGPDSITEVPVVPPSQAPPVLATPSMGLRIRSTSSAVPSDSVFQGPLKPHLPQHGAEARDKNDGSKRGVQRAIKSYEDYDWSSLVVASDAPGSPISPTSYRPLSPHTGEALRTLEQKIEKELRHRAQDLVSLPLSNVPHAVNCDFSGDVDAVQQMLVEQLFQLPSMQQPRYLRQINRSKVTLLVEEAPAEISEEFPAGGTTANDFTLPMYVLPPSVVCAIDENVSGADGNQTSLDVSNGNASTNTRQMEDSLPKWLSMTHATVPDGSVGFLPRSSTNGGISPRGQKAPRPSSAFGVRRTPTRGSSAAYSQIPISSSVSVCSRTSNFPSHVMSPASDSTSVLSHVNSWAKSTSVDLSQQAKISSAMFQSALDRYMKLDDQSYFQDMVPVGLPLQREVHWIEEGEMKTDTQDKSGLVLLLMHIRRCVDLNIQDEVALPIVKVTTGARVLIRTSIMTDRVHPVWAIEVASFITFIQRTATLLFSICDAEDETKIVYSAVMSASEFRENGGVGLRIMRLTSHSHGKQVERRDSKARLEVCMMAVTASKSNSLQRQLALETEAESSTDDLNTVYLQVLGVQGLKHRVEAIVVVSVECNGKTKEIFRTPPVAPKTRTPSWPGECSFGVVNGDGVVSFDLYHRDQFLASYDTPIDTLAFGGTGIRFFPLTRAQGGYLGESYGEIGVSILGTKTSGDENIADRDTKVLVVHVESFHMLQSSQEEFVPDPFVIIRGPQDEVILRTPLSMGTYDATWPEEDASCFIVCPSLVGSTSVYYLEVYDNNERNKIGSAEMVIATNGTTRHRLQYRIQGKGILTLYAHSFLVQKVPRPGGRAESPSTVPSEECEGDPLLLIEVSGCDGLQGTGFDDFQIDPLVTLRLGRKRSVVAPLVPGNTAPRWSYPKATILVPVRLDILNHVTFEVWDTNIDLCDVLGVARVSLESLCQSGTHTFVLQPHKDQEFGRKNDLGTITVKTRFGRLNGEVMRPGSSNFFALESSYSASLYESRLFHTQGSAPDLPVTRVRLHVSNCTSIFSDVPLQYIKVTISCLQHVLLEIQKNVTRSYVAWSVNEAQTIVDLRAIYGRSILVTVVSSTMAPESKILDVGTATVPFSVLVSSIPGEVCVRSFPLRCSTDVGQGTTSDDPEKSSNNISVTVDTSCVSISLLAVDAIQTVNTDE